MVPSSSQGGIACRGILLRLSSFQVEDRLKFYETGDLPKKNLEVMQEALEEVQKEASEFKTVEGKKKKKKDKKVSEVWGKKRSDRVVI